MSATRHPLHVGRRDVCYSDSHPSSTRPHAPPTMNIFRFLGDLSHLASILILLHKIQTTRSCRGISFKSQLLYLIVFLTRYVDLFTRPLVSVYNTVMKLFFIGSTAYTLYLMKFKYRCATLPAHIPVRPGADNSADRHTTPPLIRFSSPTSLAPSPSLPSCSTTSSRPLRSLGPSPSGSSQSPSFLNYSCSKEPERPRPSPHIISQPWVCTEDCTFPIGCTGKSAYIQNCTRDYN